MLIVSGTNMKCQLGEKSNSRNPSGKPIISPPCNSHLDITSLLSFSAYDEHSVLITKNHQLLAIGNNEDGRISGDIPKQIYKTYTEFTITNNKSLSCVPYSAVCGIQYTLYLVSDQKNEDNYQLAYSFEDKCSKPIFLNIGKRNPIAIFGGGQNAAIIDSDNAISIINESIFTMTNAEIDQLFLPNKEKAISVACCDDDIYSISATGKTFQASCSTNKYKFIEVSELQGFNIVEISGTHDHCFAVTKDGKVFGKGSNFYGKLGIGNNTKKTNYFVEIKTLREHKIKSAYAGQYHSLFQTEEGKILACGGNYHGELLLKCLPNKNCTCSPIATVIESGASFCIAGGYLSAVFVNSDPPNMIPNKKITNLPDSSSELSKLKKLLHLKEKEIEDLKKEISTLKKTKIQQNKKSSKEIKILEVNEIDDFKKEKEIGQGAQSNIIKVSKEIFFALKVLKLTNNQKINFNNLQKLLQEYEFINQIDHPNIIKSFGFCYGDKTHIPTIILEFCPYCLNDIIEELSDLERVSIIYQICLAMKYVHEANIIHRDLSPDNILLDENKNVKISDFGIATLIDVGTQSRTSGVGKLKYMAPELLLESKYYDEKVDVYSFAILVLFILTKGRYESVSVIDIGKGKRPSIPSTINQFSNNLIKECWSDNPSKRPSFDEILEKIKKSKFNIIDRVIFPPNM